MFGERYFATRKRLVRVAEDVRNLADEAGHELKGFGSDGELVQGLKNPFLFVVCGEVNAGKSTLINGLFGADMCEVNILPQTDRVLWYRHGKERNVDTTPVLEERFRDIDFLQDFNIVDTPGTNSVMPGHQAITERFLPVADLVLFVFPVSNPWGAATWDFITRFPEEMKGRVAFVLQQKDLRDEGELKIITEHMRQLAMQKLGAEPDVFAVSGKMAMEAKAREPFEERGWRESGYPALEDFISKVVTESPGRQQVLKEVRDAASEALVAIEDQIERRTKTVDEQGEFLRELDAEVDALREEYAVSGTGKLSAVGEVFLEEGAEAMQLLKSRVGIWNSLCSLFRRDETPAMMEKGLSKAVEEAVQELTEAETGEMEGLCRDHWSGAEPRLGERLETGVEMIRGTVDFESARMRVVKRMGRSARQAVFGLKLRGILEMEMDGRRNGLRRLVALTLFLVSVGGGLGAAGIHPWSWVVMGGALFTGLVAVIQTKRSGIALNRWFGERVAGCQPTFAAALRKDYLDGVRGFFGDYSKMLEGGRKLVAQNKAKLKPCLQKWNNLYVELKAIDQDL
jgi:small GTP-binding protein